MVMIYLIQALLLTFIESLCCQMFFDTFWEQKYYKSVWANRTIFAILNLGFIGISFLPTNYYILKAGGCILVIFFVMMIQYRKKKIQVAFMSFIYYGLMICIDSIMMISLNYVTESQAEKLLQDPIKGTIVALMCKTVLFLGITFINRIFRGFGSFNLITDREWIRFLFFPIITIVCMSAFAMEGGITSNAMLVASFGLVLSNFLVFYMLRDVVIREKEIMEVRLSHERSKNQMNIYEIMQAASEEQNQKIHDFNHHFDCLQGLLKNQDFKKATEYVNSISNNLIEEIKYINTNNDIVNSLLNQKMKQARKKGIQIVLTLNDLRYIPIADEHIVTIMANILDNAIESCEKVTNAPKMIKFRFVDEEGKIIISVRNPVNEPIKMAGNRLLTTKPNEEVHGIGMINIENAAKKYGGESIYNCNKGYFTHNVIISYR